MNKIIIVLMGLLWLFVAKSMAQGPIVEGEYYWDTDPGYGLGTSLGTFNTNNLDISPNISSTGLNEGHHMLYIRLKDASGIWSQVLSKQVLVGPENNPGTQPDHVRAIEYTWDSQSPQVVAITSVNDYESAINIPTTGFSDGNFTLKIRVKDRFGLWSIPYFYNVAIFGSTSNIARIEYFIGSNETIANGGADPGYGAATAISFTPNPSTTVESYVERTTVGITNGLNLITFRIKDTTGKWSPLYHKIFNNDPSFTLSPGLSHNAQNQAKTEFCLGSTIKIPITKTGTYPNGNTFTLELSDQNGANFSPLATTINASQDTLRAIIPTGLAVATGYRIRVVSSLPLMRRLSPSILTIGIQANAMASPTAVCLGSTLALGATANVASSYVWSGPDGFTNSTQNPSISNFQAVNVGTYTVVATSTAAGCTATASIAVSSKPIPTVTPTTPISICAGTPLNLAVNATAGGIYAWSGPLSYSSTSQNPTVSSSATTAMSGTYNIAVTLNGCTISGTTNVTVKPLPVVTPTTPISICANTPLDLTVNATAGATYAWTGPLSFSSSSQNPNVSSSATTAMTGTYNITVTLNACAVSNSAAVTVKPLPVVTPTTPISICAGTPLNLAVNATAGGIYAWSGPLSYSSTSQNPTVSATATTAMSGTYNIEVTLNGCSVSNSSSVTVNPAAGLATLSSLVLCPNTTTSLVATCSAGFTPNWYASASGGSSLGSGTYTTPSLASTTTYHVACESGGSPNCVSTRQAQTVTIITLPSINNTNATGIWNTTNPWILMRVPLPCESAQVNSGQTINVNNNSSEIKTIILNGNLEISNGGSIKINNN